MRSAIPHRRADRDARRGQRPWCERSRRRGQNLRRAGLSLFGCHKGSVLTVGDDRASVVERRFVMLYAAIDIHKHAFQAAVLDADSGQVVEERFSADRESLARWAGPWRGRVVAVAIEATTGWRWVWREL